jgi:hypothetical protein
MIQDLTLNLTFVIRHCKVCSRFFSILNLYLIFIMGPFYEFLFNLNRQNLFSRLGIRIDDKYKTKTKTKINHFQVYIIYHSA